MEKNSLYNQYFEERSEGIDIKKIFAKVLNKWYWLLLFGALGSGIGLAYYKYAQPTFQLSSTILLKSDNQAAAGFATLFQNLGVNSKGPDLQTQVGIIQSYSLNLKALQNLNWKYSWYQWSPLDDVDLYLDDPFEVTVSENSSQMLMAPIQITPISEEMYDIKVDATVEINGIDQEINFEGKGTFNNLFKNEYFEFTITPIENKPFNIGTKYILVFNDINKLALSYREEMQIKLDDNESNLIYVEFESKQPLRTVDYLNELGRVYIQFGLDEKNRISNNTLTFIDNQISEVTESLRIAGQNFTDFRAKNRVVNLGAEGSLVLEKLNEIESSLALAEIRLKYYKDLKKYFKDANQMKDMVAPSVVGITDPALNASVLKLNELYSQREVLSYTVQEKNPSLIALNRELSYIQKTLEENIQNLVSNTEIELNNLKEQKQKINVQLSRLPKTEQDMIGIKRTFDLNNELYTFLLQKRAETGITKASNEPEAQILDLSRMDTAIEVSPEKLQVVLIGLLLGTCFPILGIFLADYLNSKIQSLDDVEKGSTLPVLGCLAHNQYATELPVVEHPRSGIAESFRSLRTNLHFHFIDNHQKIISVHSTIPGEGKSFTSLNMATTFAMNDKKVLLVGADLRKSRLHNALSCSNEKGLSTFLIGHDNFEEVLSETRVKNLTFIASGPVPPNPAELLGSSKLEEFIREAKDRFDYVILDNAPLSLVTDGILVGRHSEVNFFILRQGYSHKEQLKYLNQVAEQGILKRIFLVLNDVKANGIDNRFNSFGNGKGYYLEDDRNTKSLWKKLESTLSFHN